jgi:glycosyltransferase involved in cell wall biosynthesis
MKPLIIHIAQIEITENTGMGRVAWHWRKEVERRGYDFIHIGATQTGTLAHPGLFPYAAYRVYKRLKRPASLILAHEPTAGIFSRHTGSTILFSHGLERRGWQMTLDGKVGSEQPIRWRTKMLFPLWRLRQCDIGLREAQKLLLINGEDAEFAQRYYKRNPSDLQVFKNGIYVSKLTEEKQPTDSISILFLGSWLERKGIRSLVEAAQILAAKNIQVHWLLAGTGSERESVLSFWPESLHHLVKVISRFSPDSEEDLFERSNIFVLPSFFEGQPLSLLQAMEAGRCCITTDCCGQRDLIQSEYNGLLHKPGDAQKLALLIEKCAGNEALRKSLGRNAKQSMQGRSWEDVSSQVIDFLEETIHQSVNSQTV